MTWNLSEAVRKKAGDEIRCLSAQSLEKQRDYFVSAEFGEWDASAGPWVYPDLELWIRLLGRTGWCLPALLVKVCRKLKPRLTERPARAGSCFWPCTLFTSPTMLLPLTLPVFTGKQCETMAFCAQADKTAISFPTVVQQALPALPGWWRDADYLGNQSGNRDRVWPSHATLHFVLPDPLSWCSMSQPALCR